MGTETKAVLRKRDDKRNYRRYRAYRIEVEILIFLSDVRATRHQGSPVNEINAFQNGSNRSWKYSF